jgi:hypothetical protein
MDENVIAFVASLFTETEWKEICSKVDELTRDMPSADIAPTP